MDLRHYSVGHSLESQRMLGCPWGKRITASNESKRFKLVFRFCGCSRTKGSCLRVAHSSSEFHYWCSFFKVAKNFFSQLLSLRPHYGCLTFWRRTHETLSRQAKYHVLQRLLNHPQSHIVQRAPHLHCCCWTRTCSCVTQMRVWDSLHSRSDRSEYPLAFFLRWESGRLFCLFILVSHVSLSYDYLNFLIRLEPHKCLLLGRLINQLHQSLRSAHRPHWAIRLRSCCGWESKG